MRSSAWLNSEFRFVRTSDVTFRDVCDVIYSELEVFWDEQNYLFWETSEYKGLGQNTFSLDDSIEYANDFLLFQNNGCVSRYSIQIA